MSLLAVFILVIGITQRVHGQACENTWTWVQPAGATTLTLSVGAPATFTVSVNDDPLIQDDVIQWKIGTVLQSEDKYDAAATPPAFQSVSKVTGITTSHVPQTGGTGNIYTMNIAQNTLTTAENGQSVTAESHTCGSGEVSPAIALTIQYCDLNTFSSDGTAATATDCGYNCVRSFTCSSDSSLSFDATCQADATWSETTPPSGRCTTCTWTWETPSGGGTVIKSVGAPATLVVMVDDSISDGQLLTWRIGSTDLSVEQYVASGPSFNSNSNPRVVTTSFDALSPGHRYTLNFPSSTGVTAADDSGQITVISGGCHGGGTSPAVTLSVSYCDLTHFQSLSSPGSAANADNCGYNCVKDFTCTSDSSLTFQATCQEDATWSDTTPSQTKRCTSCAWSWVNPTGNTMTISDGAPATLSVSVNDVIENSDTLTWKMDSTDLHVGQYDAGSSTFSETTNPRSVTTSFQVLSGGNREYTLNFASNTLTTADNGKVITVVSQGCSNSDTSPGVTLSVSNCDLTYYGSDATAADTSDCGYNCMRVFTCTEDTTKTFQATCQADATWNPSTAQCDGKREGAVLGLVMLSSIISMLRLF